MFLTIKKSLLTAMIVGSTTISHGMDSNFFMHPRPSTQIQNIWSSFRKIVGSLDNIASQIWYYSDAQVLKQERALHQQMLYASTSAEISERIRCWAQRYHQDLRYPLLAASDFLEKSIERVTEIRNRHRHLEEASLHNFLFYHWHRKYDQVGTELLSELNELHGLIMTDTSYVHEYQLAHIAQTGA